MFVLIAGGGLTGAQLAMRLLTQNHQVRLIEHQPQVLSRIHHELPTEAIYEGNAANPQVLELAGIHEADVLVAFTASDATNLVLCYVAHHLYSVRRIIAGINDPRNGWLFDQKFHVDVALDPAEILTHLIEEEMSLGDMMTLLKLRRGQFSVVGRTIPPGAKALGMAIRDLELPENCVVAAIIRHGEIVIPRGVTVLEVDDEVLAVTDAEGAEQLAISLAAPDAEGYSPSEDE